MRADGLYRAGGLVVRIRRTCAQIQIGFVTTFVANPPSGTFYLRVRGRNNAGTGSASNEVKVTVGGSGGGGGGGGGKLKVTRFLTFGDSLTRGFTSLSAPTFLLVPAYLSYPTSLQDRLRDAYPGQEIVVFNEGLDGRHCENDTGRLRDELADKKPGALLLMHCANDLQVGESGSDPSHVINYLSRLVDIGKSAGVHVFLASLPGQDKDGFREKAYEYMPGFASRVRDLASAKGATYINVYGAIPNNSSLIGDDGLHLGSSGYRKIAELYFNAIRSRYGLAAADGGIDLTLDGAGWEVLSNPDYDEDY